MGDLIDTVHLAARIPAKDRDALQKIADADDRKLSYVVRQAIKAYIEAHEREAA